MLILKRIYKPALKFVKKLSKTNIIRIGPGEAKNKSIKNLERKENKVFIFEYQKSDELKTLLILKQIKICQSVL